MIGLAASSADVEALPVLPSFAVPLIADLIAQIEAHRALSTSSAFD
jgi:hypothetical protein